MTPIPAAMSTRATVAEAVSPTADVAATPTEESRASPTARAAAPTPLVVGPPAADLPIAGQITATVAVGARPSVMAAGHGSLWVYNDLDGTLVRIDPATNEVVATIPIATPLDPATPPDDRLGVRQVSPDLAIDTTSVWAIAPAEQAVVRVDPLTNAVVATIPLEANATSIAVDQSSLWVSLYATSTVLRINTATGEVEASIRDLSTPFGIAIYQDAVWVTSLMSDRVTRIDAATNEIVEQIVIAWPRAPYGIHACNLCVWDVLANEAGVWVIMNYNEFIARIDPATSRLVAVISVGTEAKSLASDPRGIWVGTIGSLGVILIDAESNEVVAAVPAPVGQQNLPFITRWESTIWAAGRSTDDAVRIELHAQ